MNATVSPLPKGSIAWLAWKRRGAIAQAKAVTQTFQQRVQPWMMACFGPEISADRLERGDRLLEEVLELLQSGQYPRDRIAALTDYVFDRPQGEINQEVGGVMVTLAAYCLAHGLDMHQAGETELARIWTKVEKIRAKQAAKPTGSALPIAAPPAPVGEPVERSTLEDDILTPEQAWDIHINRDDRNSPEEYPEMALITFDELADFMRRAAPPAPVGVDAEGTSKAAADVLAERRRQIEVYGWTPEHDDGHGKRDLARAGVAYAMSGATSFYSHLSDPPNWWPWDRVFWKPKGRRNDLVRAAALIVAEIERIDRAALASPGITDISAEA